MQVSMLHEVDHLKDLTADMENLCRNPMQLPTSTEQLIQDFIAANDHLAPPPVSVIIIVRFLTLLWLIAVDWFNSKSGFVESTASCLMFSIKQGW